jgi:beta-mannosidase
LHSADTPTGINEADWSFRTEFETPAKLQAQTDLMFEGLDTYCKVLLNGEEILNAHNMFLSHRVSVNGKLAPAGEKNKLELRFSAPFLEAKAEEAANGGKMTLWNGDSCRLYSRKAQYGWGWDWGPIIMTVGPWKDVVLETYDYRIDNVRINADVVKTGGFEAGAEVVGNPADGVYEKCTLEVAGYDVFPAAPEGSQVIYTLTDSDGDCKLQVGSHESSWELGNSVKPWYPINYGEQPLYSLQVSLRSAEGETLAFTRQRVAFRHVEVIQEPLPEDVGGGSTFLFEVNGIRIFCGGSNWIPADNYLTEISADRYRAWVELLIAGNQNMLRVWGGGIYEVEELYNICDERGVLVWQDFMFGCGLYPSYPELNSSVKVEAEQAVARLRSHPSVVIFAGNNEDYQVAESQNVVDYNDKSGDYMHTKFPARHIYEVLLPEVVHRLSNIFYWPSSPYGGKSSGDLTVGDVHQWNVWHGTQEPWANWDKLAGRFVSEFGMQGYPNIRTVNEWFDGDEQRKKEFFPQSRVSVNHNKADGFERRLELYLMENFRHAFDMESYVYYTQAMQAETLAAAYRLWRRNWKGRGKELTSGALVWQINDCWPCVSWAICDYYLRPKPAFYAIAREMRPYTVGVSRECCCCYFVLWLTLSRWPARRLSLPATARPLRSTRSATRSSSGAATSPLRPRRPRSNSSRSISTPARLTAVPSTSRSPPTRRPRCGSATSRASTSVLRLRTSLARSSSRPA